MTKKILVGAAVLACSLALTGCRLPGEAGTAVGSGMAGGPSASAGSGAIVPAVPGSSGPNNSPPSLICERGAEPAATAPTAESEPVITLTYSSPWSPGWSQLPELVVYSDGSAARNPDSVDRVSPDDEPRPGLAAADAGHFDACLLQELQAELIDLRPADGDFGDPNVVDAGHTTVQVRPDEGSPEVVLSAYFLQQDNAADDNLTPEQRQARQRLSSVVDQLLSGFQRTGRLPVERVKVVDAGSYPSLRPIGDPYADPVAWPLGDELPSELRGLDRVCAEITGENAVALAAAVAPDAYNSRVHQGEFTVGDVEAAPFEFGISVLMPGIDGCG